MAGINNIFDIAWSGLYTRQKALEVVSHNIANTETPGYHRQDVLFVTSQPISDAIGMIGTGVDITEIRRFKDDLLDLQVRNETSALNRWETMKDTLDQVEAIFKEPTTNGLTVTMNEFWNAWQDLANNPEDNYTRLGVLETGRWLGQHINLLANSLESLRDNMDTSAVNVVNQINSLAERIAEVNADISVAVKSGNRPNDQLDRRDELLNQLAELVNIQVVEDKARGTVSVFVSGDLLLSDTDVQKIDIEEESVGDFIISRFVWHGSDEEVDAQEGLLKGFIDSRDEVIQDVVDRLDQLAASLIEEVNSLHEAGLALDGTTGNSFFEPYTAPDGSNRGTARNMRLSDVVNNNLDKIAAAEVGGTLPGDNTNALAIADLRNTKVMESGSMTHNSYYANMIAEVGFATRRGDIRRENHELARDQFRNMRDSATGVSLDEEMTRLIRFQHGYQASARLVKMADELLSTLINLGR